MKKISKRVLVGTVEYPSLTAAAKVLKIHPTMLSKKIKTNKALDDGTPVSFVK